MSEPLVALGKSGQQLLPLTLEAAQNRIDHPHRPGFAECAGAFGGLVDGGVVGNVVPPQLVEPDKDEPVDVAVAPF